MLCDLCGKIKATVHLTEVINDQVTKLNLCEVCAKKKGAEMEQHFGIADLLQGLAGGAQEKTSASSALQKLKCAQCGISFEEFKKIGRLGCSACYLSFREHLAPLLKRIHGSNRHSGKTPRSAPGSAAPDLAGTKIKTSLSVNKASEIIDQLRVKLRKAVVDEAYEEAARLRDEIKNIEAKGRKSL